MAQLILLIAVSAGLLAQPQPPPAEPLWPNGAPGALGDTEADKPSLTSYVPAHRGTRTAVVICPGGGYRSLAMDHEGRQVAQWLNSLGVAAFILQYRLGPRYRHPAPLDDVRRAIRVVRSRAAAHSIAPDRIGVWGFSAGGHLASSAATHFDSGNPSAADPLDRPSSRPDFAILGYPVISFTTGYAHKGSRTNLLGEAPDASLVQLLSTELQVKPDTPPTFLFHTNEDSGVPPENSVLFYLALRKHGIPAEMHIYERGRHGVGLASTDATLASWPARLADWLRTRGLLSGR